MGEKLREVNNGLKIIILVFFVIAFGYFVFAAIGLAFEEDEGEIVTNVDIDNIDKYITKDSESGNGSESDSNNTDSTDNPGNTDDSSNVENITKEIDESKIVKDYSKFYTIQNAIENFVDCLLDGDYTESYSVLSSEMKNKYSRNEYVEKIESFQKANFPIDDPDTMFINSNKLMNAYQISEGEEYIVEYNNYESKTIKFGIRLNSTKKEYTIFYIEF